MGERGRWARWCAWAAALLALSVVVLGGATRRGYSHSAQYISELGERGADDGAVVSVAGFLPVGVLALAFVVLTVPLVRVALGWRAALGVAGFGGVGVAYVVAGFARCEAGCPSSGDLTQTLHNVGGAVEYLGGAAGLLVFGLAVRNRACWQIESYASLVLVPVVLALVGLSEVDGMDASRGTLQRVVEVLLFGWMLWLAQRLVRGSPAVSGPARGR